MMIQVNDKVLINIPEASCHIVDAAVLKQYNRRIATVLETGETTCRLSIDNGQHNWPYHILAVPLPRKGYSS